jgi:hypothetical protein
VSLVEDEHVVGVLGAGGEDEPFGVGVGLRAARWDLADGDAGVGRRGVEGGGELPGPVGSVQTRLRVLPAQDRVLVAENQDLYIFGRTGLGEESEPAGDAAEHEVAQA